METTESYPTDPAADNTALWVAWGQACAWPHSGRYLFVGRGLARVRRSGEFDPRDRWTRDRVGAERQARRLGLALVVAPDGGWELRDLRPLPDERDAW